MVSRFILSSCALVMATVSLAGPALAREVTHAMGTTEVPDNPQRIVVLTNEATEALLALGITPVGAVKSWLGNPWYEHIATEMGDVVVLGEESAVNLEVIVSLEPDLILGTKIRHEAIYEQLSAIAPTVVSERLRGDWQENFGLTAEAVGKSAEGDALLSAYNERVTALSTNLGAALEEEVAVARFMAGRTRSMLKDSFSGVVLSQLGFHRPATQDKNEFMEELTKERIPELNGDRLFVFTYDTGNNEGIDRAAEWTADPLWQNLPVVKAGKVYEVSDAIWNTAGGILAAHLLLDDIATHYGVDAAR